MTTVRTYLNLLLELGDNMAVLAMQSGKRRALTGTQKQKHFSKNYNN